MVGRESINRGGEIGEMRKTIGTAEHEPWGVPGDHKKGVLGSMLGLCRPFGALGWGWRDPGAAARASARLAPGYSLSPLTGLRTDLPERWILGIRGLQDCWNGEFSRQAGEGAGPTPEKPRDRPGF
jgi:hypothetical protein